ncbi:hypothetical protein D7D25_00560 [Proteiniphilum sp. X52]|nr:hypothetical protein D7D25_00560 [Proteiniphilum sp. X52]
MLRSCFEFFHPLFFSHFLMDLDFHLLKCSGLLKRNESSKAQKRAKNNMKERKNKRKIITRKIQNSFLFYNHTLEFISNKILDA